VIEPFRGDNTEQQNHSEMTNLRENHPHSDLLPSRERGRKRVEGKGEEKRSLPSRVPLSPFPKSVIRHRNAFKTMDH